MRNAMLIVLFLVSACDEAALPPGPPAELRVDRLNHPDGHEVRQGGTSRVVLEGEHLERAELVVSGARVDRIDEATFDVTIDHGSPLGARALEVRSPVATFPFPDALLVTPAYVDPVRGDDDARGTPAQPLRTLRAVAERAQAGDEIALAAGVHTISDGLIIPDGVRVRGAGAGETLVMVPSCGTYLYCIVLWGELSDLRLVSEVDHALAIGNDGVLRDAELVGGDTGAVLQQRARVERITVLGSAKGISVLGSDAVVKDARISGCSYAGLTVDSLPGTGRVTIEGTTVEQSQHGLVVASPSPQNVVVRGSAFLDNQVGVRLTAQDLGLVLDFGSSATSGANRFAGNTLHVKDERIARTGADGPIATFVGTTFDGVDPEGMITGAAEQLPLYDIAGANNRLQF